MGRTYSFASATSASTIAVNIKASGVDIIHIAGTLNFDCGRDHPYIRGGPGPRAVRLLGVKRHCSTFLAHRYFARFDGRDRCLVSKCWRGGRVTLSAILDALRITFGTSVR